MENEFVNKVKEFLPSDYRGDICYVAYLNKTIISISKVENENSILEVKCYVEDLNDMGEAKSIALSAKDAIENRRISYVSDAFGYPIEVH